MTTLILGVDPGMTTGICALYAEGYAPRSRALFVQVHGPEGVVTLVEALLARSDHVEAWLSVEKFVTGTRASRSAHPWAGVHTRQLIGQLQECIAFGRWCSWSAATVKGWATDERLAAAGMLDGTKGMGHARDAARHALYAAVKAGVVRDPLSGRNA